MLEIYAISMWCAFCNNEWWWMFALTRWIAVSYSGVATKSSQVAADHIGLSCFWRYDSQPGNVSVCHSFCYVCTHTRKVLACEHIYLIGSKKCLFAMFPMEKEGGALKDFACVCVCTCEHEWKIFVWVYVRKTSSTFLYICIHKTYTKNTYIPLCIHHTHKHAYRQSHASLHKHVQSL